VPWSKTLGAWQVAFTQVPPQQVIPGPQSRGWHVPEMQSSHAAHAVPHAPQFCSSVLKSRQDPSQHVRPAAQSSGTQAPLEQRLQGPHWCPHAPQFSASSRTLRQASPQHFS
jgi:hypothetical protein